MSTRLHFHAGPVGVSTAFRPAGDFERGLRGLLLLVALLVGVMWAAIVYWYLSVPLVLLAVLALALLVRRRRTSPEPKHSSRFGQIEQFEELPFPIRQFSIGEEVEHDHFGRGTVIELSREGRVASVFFPAVGTKRLLLALAPLTAI